MPLPSSKYLRQNCARSSMRAVTLDSWCRTPCARSFVRPGVMLGPSNKRREMATKTASRRTAAQPKHSIPQTLLRIVNSALDDMKAVNVKVLDVRHLTDITDIVVIASGNSDRHVKSIADRVL